jgi:hypothetical protein
VSSPVPPFTSTVEVEPETSTVNFPVNAEASTNPSAVVPSTVFAKIKFVLIIRALSPVTLTVPRAFEVVAVMVDFASSE